MKVYKLHQMQIFQISFIKKIFIFHKTKSTLDSVLIQLTSNLRVEGSKNFILKNLVSIKKDHRPLKIVKSL